MRACACLHRSGLPVLRCSPVRACCRHYPGGTANACRSCWHTSQLDFRSRWQPSPQYCRIVSRIRAYRGLLGVYSRYGLTARQITHVILSSKTPTASLPPPPLRLLPAGTTPCRAGLTPAEEQRLCTAYNTSGPYGTLQNAAEKFLNIPPQIPLHRPLHLRLRHPPSTRRQVFKIYPSPPSR